MKALALSVLVLQLLPAGVLAQPGEKSSPIVATLSLPHPKVLPGVPFDLEVTFKNVSKSVASVGLIAFIRVTLPDGTVAAPKDRASVWLGTHPWDVDETYRELAPGESVTKSVSSHHGFATNWSYDPRFSGPGMYDVSLELRRPDDGEKIPSYVGPIVTSSVRLERAVPSGEDEELWKRMKAAANGSWPDNGFQSLKSGLALAKEILQLHPGSSYYPYALLTVVDVEYLLFRGEEKFQKFRDAAERFPASPAHPYLVVAAADAASGLAGSAVSERNPAKAAELYKRAAEWYRAADKTGSLAVQKWSRMHASVSERSAREKANQR